MKSKKYFLFISDVDLLAGSSEQYEELSYTPDAFSSRSQSVQNQQGKHACQYCLRLFSTKSHAKRHEAIIHLKERPFACTICDKKFSTNANRKNHMIVHYRLDVNARK